MDDSPRRQLRLVIEVADLDAALRLYRDALGLPVLEAFTEDNGGRAVLLDVGTATLEVADAAHRRAVDQLEVGRDTGDRLRVAFEVADADAVAAGLVDAGATLVATVLETPWGSRNARLESPDGLPLTVFQEP